MYLIIDKQDIIAALKGLTEDYDDLYIIEVELSDIVNKIIGDPKIGLSHALEKSKKGKKVILICQRDYPELEGWGDLEKRKNVKIIHRSYLFNLLEEIKNLYQ